MNLVLLVEGQQVSVPLTEPGITVGRAANAAVRIPSHSVSRIHAKIFLQHGLAYIADMNSGNGTLVNGRRISGPTPLFPGDQLSIGLEPVKVLQAPQPETGDGDHTMIIGSKAPGAPAAPAAPPQPAAPSLMAPAPSVPVQPLVRSTLPPLPDLASIPSLEAVPIPPPPPEARPKPPPLPEFVLKVPERSAPQLPPPPPPSDQTDTMKYFDRLVTSIRSGREEHKKKQEEEKSKVEVEWGKVIDQARALRTRIGNSPHVKFFTIARDNREVSITLYPEGGKPGKFFTLSRGHPEGQYGALDAIWLRQLGLPDRHYLNADEVMLEVVRGLAHLFA